MIFQTKRGRVAIDSVQTPGGDGLRVEFSMQMGGHAMHGMLEGRLGDFDSAVAAMALFERGESDSANQVPSVFYGKLIDRLQAPYVGFIREELLREHDSGQFVVLTAVGENEVSSSEIVFRLLARLLEAALLAENGGQDIEIVWVNERLTAIWSELTPEWKKVVDASSAAR